jgi:hypothetical protein
MKTLTQIEIDLLVKVLDNAMFSAAANRSKHVDSIAKALEIAKRLKPIAESLNSVPQPKITLTKDSK